MKKAFKTGLFIIILIVAGSILVWKFYINKSKPDIKTQQSDFHVKATDLYKAYYESDTTIMNKYNNKILSVSGVIDTIEKQDSFVNILFVFGKDDFGKTGIRVSLIPELTVQASTLKKAMNIKVKGINKGYNGSDVIIESAILVNNQTN